MFDRYCPKLSITVGKGICQEERNMFQAILFKVQCFVRKVKMRNEILQLISQNGCSCTNSLDNWMKLQVNAGLNKRFVIIFLRNMDSDSDQLSDDFLQNTKKSTNTGDLPDLTSETNNQSESSTSVSHAIFSCKFCQVSFTVKSNCNRHEKHCSLNVDKGPARFPCPHCKSPFHRKSHLTTHLKKCSKEVQKTTAKKTSTPCLIKGCGASFFFKTQLIDHLTTAHPDAIKIKPKESLAFKSVEEFFKWKEKEEEATFSYFTARKGQGSSTTKHFYCQHDGTGKSQRKRKTSRVNNKGRVKVGHYCMAKMKVTESEKEVHVLYYPIHSHVCKKEDMLHHPLPAAMSKFINEKLAENIPPTAVYDLVKEHFLPKNNLEVLDTRASILTKKRILERGRRRRMARRLHKDDAKAVYLLVNQLLEKDDSVLIYKPCGRPVVHGPEGINNLVDSTDLFMFAFQTDRQLELMKNHCSKIILVDETHGTNQYKYQLLTVMVLDENRRGWPVAHLITSKSDGLTLSFLYEAINSRLDPDHQVSINCVITDDDPALINSMEAGFSKKIRHLLCKWHVFKNLRDQLRSKVPHELFDTMLSEIKVIMNAESEGLFLKLKDGFINKYQSDTRASIYLSYLDQHYWKRAEKWAMCYRNFPHCEVNTTGFIESFHNRLKKFYLKRKVNKRLDDLIGILYGLEWDDYCSRVREASIGFAVQPQHILQRHKRGLLMEDSMIIEQCLDKLWEVKSASGSSAVYLVERHKDSCNSDFCFSKCSKPECHGVCAHLFSCSCSDHHPLCKHIHKLQSFLTKGDPFVPIAEEEFYNLETAKNTEDLQIEFDQETHHQTTQSAILRRRNIVVERIQSNVSLLQQFILAAQAKSDVPEHTLTRVDSVLSDLVQGLEQHTRDDLPTTMEPVESWAPNERLKTQVSQLSSFKKPQKRKRKDDDPSSVRAKKQAAIDNLLTCALIEPNDGYNSDTDAASVQPPCFTLPLSYVNDPRDWVLQCGGEKISLLHLKSLEENLLDGEEDTLRKRDQLFKRGWLYCTIVNSFLSKLSQKNENMFVLSSDLSCRASRRISNFNFLLKYKESLMSKEIIFCPVNFGNHWCMLAVYIKEEEIRYYDPMQAPLSNSCVALLSQMVADMKLIYSSSSRWKIKVVQKPKQVDSTSCGPLVCQYVIQCIDPSASFCSIYDVRKHIYDVIVGKCLQRSHHELELCGTCGVKYSDDRDLLKSWVSCSNCDQWFHDSCLVRKGDDIVCQ